MSKRDLTKLLDGTTLHYAKVKLSLTGEDSWKVKRFINDLQKIMDRDLSESKVKEGALLMVADVFNDEFFEESYQLQKDVAAMDLSIEEYKEYFRHNMRVSMDFQEGFQKMLSEL